MNGELFKLWQVNCASCGRNSYAIVTHYAAEAAKQLRKYGWRLRRNPEYDRKTNWRTPANLWHCENCAKAAKKVQP